MYDFPLKFGYIPYPLWRRHWPEWMAPAVKRASHWIYPVDEDENPPGDIGRMTHYLIRYRLLPQLTLREIAKGLAMEIPHMEEAPQMQPPEIAPMEPVRVPAQWEEKEAVVLNWPVLYPPLWEMYAQMAKAIAPVAKVTITVPEPMWAQAAWLYLKTYGCTEEELANIEFLILLTYDIWVRDYGPILGYSASGERIVVKTIYNHLIDYPQEHDDVMALRWAKHNDLRVMPTHLHTEGGNFWSDGAGTLLMTDQIFIANPGYNRKTMEDYLHRIFEYEKLIIVPRMAIERTGHIDLVFKLADQQTILLSAPEEWTSSDRLQQTKALFQQQNNASGDQYNLIHLPTPKIYFNWLTYPIRRSYTNALTINGRVLVPIYSINTDDAALRAYEQAMPQHQIIPIDCKVGANGGGAVHCMTKEIPIK